MFSVFKQILGMLWGIAKFVIIPVAAILCVLGLITLAAFIIALAQGKRRPDGEHKIYIKPSLFKRLFVQFPLQFIDDLMSRPKDWFAPQGVIIYTGRQGSGKTVALVEHTLRLQYEYPSCKVISNLAYKYQDDELSDWRQLIDYKNGHRGVIVQMDELQNWFSSNQSKDFPPELLEVITQNRKNRRVILGTSQVFTRLSKPLREQTTEVRKCFTLFGCLTFVHAVVPELDSSGDVLSWKHRKFYWFVHTPEIRNAYDTYHVIESLSKSGFQPKQADSAELKLVVNGQNKKRK